LKGAPPKASNKAPAAPKTTSPGTSATTRKHHRDRVARRKRLFERVVEQPINIVLAPAGMTLVSPGGQLQTPLVGSRPFAAS
jgi:hypothetical protein